MEEERAAQIEHDNRLLLAKMSKVCLRPRPRPLSDHIATPISAARACSSLGSRGSRVRGTARASQVWSLALIPSRSCVRAPARPPAL